MLVFDATAIVGLFRSHPIIYTLWEAADAGRQQIVLPALAVVEAGGILETHPSAWDVFLEPGTVNVLPLTEDAAVEVAGWSGTPAAKHCLFEASRMGWPLVTCDPRLYTAGQVNLYVV